MVSEDFKSGDLVWAKMKSYPAWPAKIVDPPSDTKAPKHKKAHFVKFFGSENFAWIPDENIVHHSESVLNASSKKKSALFQKAIDALISCSRKEKQSSPKIRKEKIPNVNKNSHKVVKVINAVTKRQNRKVLTHKSPNQKRSSQDMNGERNINATSTLGKVPKYNSTDNSSVRSILNDYSSFDDAFYDITGLDGASLETKHLEPSPKKFGFIGLGRMGDAIVSNLIASGHNVTVWNRHMHKCEKFIDMGAKRACSPADLVVECDITFCCVSDPESSKALIFGDQGILQGLQTAEHLGLGRKGYVELTSIDPDTSLEINEAITMKNGVYLEAPLCGTSKHAQKGTLLVLASGDRRLFAQCETCFHAIGTHAYYLTCDVGYAAKVTLILSMLSGTVCALVAEALVLAEKLQIDKQLFFDAIRHGPLDCDKIRKFFHLMTERNFKTITPLSYMQNGLGLAQTMSNDVSHPMPITAAANEVYQLARMKYRETDMSTVYKVLRY